MKASLHQTSRASSSSSTPIRLLTAVPICDGHDSAINTINLEFIRQGIEVIYLGYHRSARDIVRAAIQEDVRAIGLSSYNGGHVEFFREVKALLRKRGAGDIGLFGGGGGTITPADARVMEREGTDRIFFAGTPLDEMVSFVCERYGKPAARPAAKAKDPDRQLAHQLSATENGARDTGFENRKPKTEKLAVGITGPGGAGKTTLIDELVLRLLQANPRGRLAILSHDPSLVGAGALLGDRATMIYSQDDRVFMRSLASRGRAGGLSPTTERCLKILKHAGFDMVLVETVGIGQEALPFARALVDRSVLVMSPDYGSRLQLQKIVMLEAADVVVVNKADLAGASTARAELEHRLAANRRGQRLIATVAKRHGDPGVDELFREVCS
jgi:methylmalonyl-CoA mutase